MHRFRLAAAVALVSGVQARRYVLAGFAATQAGCRLESVALPPQGEALALPATVSPPGAGFYRLWGQHLAQSVRQNWPSVRLMAYAEACSLIPMALSEKWKCLN